jgi:diguanylate cyclase (GGDEF)-like protein/PAS domain S-box-containing protein
MMLGMGNTPTVLIVDDEPINIHLLAGILGSEYEIKVANSGKLALTVATQKPYPDLILLDVMMPEMDGFEVCELLKANPATRHIPIIFITAAFTRLSEVKGLKLGAVDYITKPIDKDITRLRVRNHILLKLSEERLREHDALLNSMFDNAPTAILIIAKNGSPLLVNKTGLDLFGVDSLEQFRSVHLVQFIEPDFREAYQQMLTNTYQGQCCDQMDLSMVNQKGLRRWLRIKPSPLCDGEKRVIGTLFMISDVTGSRHAEEQLRLSARVFESTQEGILVTDVDGCIVSVNEAFSQITGYASEDVVGKNPKILKSNEHNSKFYKEMWDSIKASGQWQGEIWNRKKGGSLYPERLTISSIFDDQDQLTHYVGVFSDNTLIKQHEKELEHIAHYDILTGLPNRFLLDDRLQQAIAQSQREKTILAVCYLDLDSFKPINDKFGHETGDQVLIETANRLKKSVRNVDTVARLGGDEFVILLCKLADIKECLMTVERILGVLSTPMMIEKQHCQVSCSIGVTLFPEGNVTADILLRHADQAMYVAKQNGKNNYYFFNKDQERKILSLSKMMRQIEQALSSQEFELFYQPKIQIQSGALVGAEALIRWNHPQDGLLLPGQFLPFIRNSELELNLGDWVIQNAIQQICQ